MADLPSPRSTPPIRLIAGLGNDDRSYHLTFHNAGFWAVDVLAERRGWDWREKKLFFSAGDGPLSLAKARSYMNSCGPNLKEALLKAGGNPAEMLVVSDDFMLPEGRLRLRRGGSSGGHNGFKSLIDALGTDDFPRLRIGVGPVPPGVDPADYVLKKVPASRMNALAIKAADAVEACLTDGIEKAMNRFNAKDVPPPSPSV
jgi:PTH1 family peptidyl-tRNA hydrolase